MDEKINAIKFYEDEIYQMEGILKGFISDEYRKFIETKKTFYEIAVIAIKNS